VQLLFLPDINPPLLEIIMLKSLFFIFRITLAWILAFVLICNLLLLPLLEEFIAIENALPFGLLLIALFIGGSGFSHVRRVRLIANEVNTGTLPNRHLRQIEIPFEAGAAFTLIDAAIRELPGCEAIDSARDSLQVRAKIQRIQPYANLNLLGRFSATLDNTFGVQRNQILATVTPNGATSSLTILCEPEHPAWGDWFLMDHGTNLENIQALGRAITHRVSALRRAEQTSVTQTIAEKELSVAKLNMLQAQVEPHFLYNTLASAQLLTRADPAKADIMLGNLILYLRHSLPRNEDGLSTLGAELERALAYLDILKIRMGARLNLQIEVPDTLKTMLFPGMMLQTLVENAIKHGLEPKPGGGTIWILARNIDQMAALTVADDGRGFSAEGGGTGIGLRNVRERLQLTYGSAASFSIVSNFPNGVAATITVPNKPVPRNHHGQQNKQDKQEEYDKQD
jgi:Histidine kinase